MKKLPAIPEFNRRLWRLVGRNFLVWRKLMMPSLAANLADPMIFLLGFGFGVGALVGDIDGKPYLHFIAAGMVCYGAMNGASFESLYSAFTRMHVQRTWESILNAPMTLDDIVLGEWVWAAAKGAIAGSAMLLVLLVLVPLPLATVPTGVLVLIVVALTFSAIGLAVNAVARNYDFFSYYFTLFITPMMMLSGAFFPLSVLPETLQTLSSILPLTAAVQLMRAVLDDNATLISCIPPLALLAAYTAAGIYTAVILTRRRLQK